MSTASSFGFVELIVRPLRRGRRRRDAAVTMRLPGGHRLRIEGRADPQVIRAVLESLLAEKPPC